MPDRSLTPSITVTIGHHTRIYFAFVTTAPVELDSPATVTPRIDGALLSQYDHISYQCCSGNFLRVARRGAAERRRHHGTANGLLNQ